MIKDYNERAMRILINHDSALMFEFSDRRERKDGTESGDTLKDLYHEIVKNDPKLIKKYNQFVLDEEIPEDSPLVAEIRRLVKQYGWRQFLLGIRQFAEKKAKYFLNLGMNQRAEPWLSIKEKIATVRKTAEL